jgi:hypothetical protein
MKILPEIRQKVQEQILPLIPPAWKPQFMLGLKAFSLQKFESINANARKAGTSEQAGERQAYRLLNQSGMLTKLMSVMLSLFQIDERSVIAIDFSSFGVFQVLCFSLQTRDGRAIPVWVDVLTYPIKDEDSQNLFILDSLQEFLALVNCTPKIVCDRGFIESVK